MKTLSTGISIYLLALATIVALTPDHPHFFKLRSLAPPFSNTAYNKLFLSTYHIAPALNYAILSPPDPGIIGFLNGTAAEIAREDANLIFDFGNGGSEGEPTYYGFIIDQVNVTDAIVEINAGDDGTRGIFVDEGGLLRYRGEGREGGFYGESLDLMCFWEEKSS